ncbi:hypothetical protein HYS54_03775 [Candidatus Micrarchaeota archaeon]|nr:hypothetical protein [Candidatus Micrarchaeota archaeon]
MGFTQIVSVQDSKEELRKSLQRISTKKIVFLADKENIESVLRLRNEFALAYSLPTEVRNTDEEDLKHILQSYGDAVVHIADHHHKNYDLVSHCHLLGLPLYISNGENFHQLPTPPHKFKDLFSQVQLSIFRSLSNEPLTLSQLAEKTGLMEMTLYHYMHGKDSSKGLVDLGLIIQKGDFYTASEFANELLRL